MYSPPWFAHRLFALLLGLMAAAVAPSGQSADPTAQNTGVTDQQPQVADQLNRTLAAIEAKRDQIKALKQRLKTAQDGPQVGALALATTVAGKAPTELYGTKTERVTWRFPVEPEDP